MSKKTFKVTLVKSLNGRLANHKACAKNLGLRKMHQTAEIVDNACTRGMANTIAYLLKIED